MQNIGVSQQPRKLPQQRVVEPGSVLVADCSLSMSTVDGARGFGGFAPIGAKRRIDNLAKVLGYLLSRTRLQALVCFNDCPIELELQGRLVLPEPDGGTALHLALEYVGGLAPKPRRVIVLCDGHPNVPLWALDAAARLRPTPIDAYFVGEDGDAEALAFMEQLARAGGPGGSWGRYDMTETNLLGEELRLRITGPR